jgi:hypothetical protein
MRWFAFLMAFLSSSLVMAECPKDDKVCFDVSVGPVATAVNIKTGALLMTFPLGPCFGFTIQSWHVGMDACLNVQVATKTAPNMYTPSLQIHVAKFGAVGIGGMCQQRSTEDGIFCQAVAFVAARVPVGGW